MCLYQTSGLRPPPITGRFVNTVTRGWVGAPNGRAPFRFHGAVVGFVARCLSRTRNLAASNKHLAEFFSGRSWPKIGPGTIFGGVLKSLKLFVRRFVLITSGKEIFWRVSLKLFFLMETLRFHCHRSDKSRVILILYFRIYDENLSRCILDHHGILSSTRRTYLSLIHI